MQYQRDQAGVSHKKGTELPLTQRRGQCSEG